MEMLIIGGAVAFVLGLARLRARRTRSTASLAQVAPDAVDVATPARRLDPAGDSRDGRWL